MATTEMERSITFENLQPLQVVQYGRSLLKVSTKYDDGFTAEVLLDFDSLPPLRTKVRRFRAEVATMLNVPGQRTLNQYEDYTGMKAVRD